MRADPVQVWADSCRCRSAQSKASGRGIRRGEDCVSEAVDSALAQTYRATEVVVVDDGSTDGTWDVLRTYGDDIQLVRQDNRGPAAARNLGVAVSTGEFVALLDADDIVRHVRSFSGWVSRA